MRFLTAVVATALMLLTPSIAAQEHETTTSAPPAGETAMRVAGVKIKTVVSLYLREFSLLSGPGPEPLTYHASGVMTRLTWTISLVFVAFTAS